MKYQRIDGEFPCLKNTAVTLGKFDGIHAGHRKLVECICRQKQNGLQAVVLAFDTGNPTILSGVERKRVLESLGVDVLLECPLNETIRHKSPREFAGRILAGSLGASYIAVGEDYRFGYNRTGNAALLRTLGSEFGFEVEIAPSQMDGGRKVSSTYIREELEKGNMEKIADLLGTRYFLDGKVEHGRGIGHRHLLPTANLIPSKEKRMPPNGVYVTISHFPHRTYGGITNIGYKPTIGEQFLGVESYLFDCEEDLYGEECRVEFLYFARPERKFDSLEELRGQLLRDADYGKAYLKKMVYRKVSMCYTGQDGMSPYSVSGVSDRFLI